MTGWPADLVPSLGAGLALVGLGAYAGFHVAGVAALSPSWWRLPPGLRGRAAGSFHRFGPAPRAVLGGVAMAGLVVHGLARSPGSPLQAGLVLGAVGLGLASVACVLPALPLETRLVRLFFDAAGAERDREFIEAQARWDRWQSARALLSGTAFVMLAASILT